MANSTLDPDCKNGRVQDVWRLQLSSTGSSIFPDKNRTGTGTTPVSLENLFRSHAVQTCINHLMIAVKIGKPYEYVFKLWEALDTTCFMHCESYTQDFLHIRFTAQCQLALQVPFRIRDQDLGAHGHMFETGEDRQKTAFKKLHLKPYGWGLLNASFLMKY